MLFIKYGNFNTHLYFYDFCLFFRNDEFNQLYAAYENHQIGYYSSLHLSTLNVFAVINDLNYQKLNIIYEYIMEKVSEPECNQGGFMGFFQTINSDGQWYNSRIIPIDKCGGLQKFKKNLVNLTYNSQLLWDDNTVCTRMVDNIKNIMSNAPDTKQYNVLFVDASPKCIEFLCQFKNVSFVKLKKHKTYL